MNTECSKNRIGHLDSLRGLAALCVSLTHSIQCFNGVPFQGYINNVLGQSPVVFFYLLSGFVLGKSLHQDLSFPRIIAFYLRRIFRLYPAALAAVFLAYIISRFYPDVNHLDVASPFLREWISKAESVHLGADFFSMMFLQPEAQYLNSPLWTIKVEFICSLLFPLLLAWMKFIPRINFLTVAFLTLFLWRGIDYGSRFLFVFYLGNLLGGIAPGFVSFSEKTTKTALLMIATLWLFSMRYGFDLVTESIVLGFAFAILVPCNWMFLRNLLDAPAVKFLGKISYSFYLLHCPLLFLIWSILAKNQTGVILLKNTLISLPLLFISSCLACIAVASLCERFVERPWNQLGHRISKSMSVFFLKKRDCTT